MMCWLGSTQLDVDRVRETKNSCRSLVENVFENGHTQDRKGDRRILLTLIACTTFVICEEEGIVFSEGAERERVRAWSVVSAVTKLWVGRATNRAENLTSRPGVWGPTQRHIQWARGLSPAVQRVPIFTKMIRTQRLFL